MTQDSTLKFNKKIILGIGIFLGIYIISLFVPFVSSYTRYPLYIVKCGGLPIEGSTFAAGNTYTVPGTKAYKVNVFSDNYFCSEVEAQSAGFRKYDYFQD